MLKKSLSFSSFSSSGFSISSISSHPLFGIICMLINTMALAIIDVAVKTLRDDLPAGVIMLMYKVGLLVVIMPWILKEGLGILKTKRIWSHVLRSIFSVSGGLCFYHGLRFVDMADAAALENLQYIIVAFLGIIFFAEQISFAKIIAIALGFLGALVVSSPNVLSVFSGDFGAVSFNYSRDHLLIILAILFWACNTITVKLLSVTENNKTQLFYLLLIASLIALPSAIFKWSDIDVFGFSLPIAPELVDFSNIKIELKHIGLIALAGFGCFVHGVAYFNALRSELSVVIPFRYSKLIFSGVLGWWLFNESYTLGSYVGYALIVGAGLILANSQIQKSKKGKEQLIA